MATAAENDYTCHLVQVGTLELEYNTLELEDEADLDPTYYGIVVLFPDKVMVADVMRLNLRLHSLQDGHLLAVSDRLESLPYCVCICSIHDNKIQVAACLWKGLIEILSVQSTGQTSTITRVRKLNVRTEFDRCYGVKYLNEKLLICGFKQYNLNWGIVSITDGDVDKVHKICKCDEYSGSYLCTNPRDDNMVYISCHAGDEYHDNDGVYGYKNSTLEFLYQHKDLNNPSAVTTDRRGFLFVCNKNPPCIHHLTEKGQLVTIYREGMPSTYLIAIFWEEQQGLLYTTSDGSKVITLYRPVYSDHQDTAAIPAEILRMNDRSIQLFKEALKHGEVRVYNIRVMVVGHLGVGKTTMIKRLLGKKVNITDRQSTEGIIVHVHCCRVLRDTWKWTSNEGDSEQDLLLHRLAKVLNEKQPAREKVADKKSIVIFPQKKNTPDSDADYDKDTQPLDRQSSQQNFPQNLSSTTSQKDKSLSTVDQRNLTQPDTNPMARSELERESHKGDPIRETLQLLQNNADKLKPDIGRYAPLTMWDFAGQYAFYTTHQMFLTRRAIYLLVSDVSGQISDLVKDECYFDSEGIRKCKVHELVEVWLNSIHSCAPADKENMNSTYSQTRTVVPPPVILVGTHVDQIPQEDRLMVCERYFNDIRCHLSSNPSRFHLVDEDFAIDNTVVDSTLDDLKRKIVEVASQQLYWGEKIPAQWLPLEQALMKLKAEGVKVIPLSLVEDLNQAGAVQMSEKELDLFLRFQHDIGTILYFSMEVLKDNIVLDPQWMIDALKSLITAEMFVLRSTPAVSEKWFEFKKNGKLTPELIDAIWTKENNPDLHDNKKHILLLMEHLNVIAKPRLYDEDESKIKEVKYFLAPCMLRQKAPREIICPKLHNQMESSSVLCYVFQGKFLPPPIFHRLLAACVAHWPLATKKNEDTLENQIFCSCCIFQLDEHHKLTLHFRDYIIFMRVTRQGIKDKTPSSKLCIEVKEFVTGMLVKIIGYLGQSLKFEQFIQCPEYNGHSVKSLIPVSRVRDNAEVRCDIHDNILESYVLLKCWFEAVEQPGDGNAGKLHNIVLSRCMRTLLKNLEFGAVFDYIIEKELFDEIILRDIKKQKTTTEQTREVIKRVQQRGQGTYEKFKDCLVLAKQASLKALLEEEEATVSNEINKKHKAQDTVILGDNKNKPTAKSIIRSSLESTDTKGHVMISYDWGQQPKALWIKDQLEANGFTVWMDVENMGSNLLPSMAEVIGKAHVVLVCMSQRYKGNKNCEREATYAAEKKKIMIPLKMERDFTNDGWLGILTTGLMFYDFSGKYPFEKNMRELLAKLARCYGKKIEEPRIVPFLSSDTTYDERYRQTPYDRDRITVEHMTRQDKNLAYLHELQRMEPKIYAIYEAVDDRDGRNSKELTIRKGDILLVLDSSRNWWKVENYKEDVGYVPNTCLKATETENADRDKEDSQQHQQKEEGQDTAATPITQEHINHARLCNALTTVCADALRKILLTQVPAPHTNIYQAVLANQANLTSRRQVKPGQRQNALLNKDQSQLVFPDPKGRYIATVDQFDISLLYTMIRNISSVTAPTTHWGKPPVDQPRDTTLGASVERIRSYRNSISGHSVDGKISQQEFENYWNKIEDVLHDIENAIGNQGYREDLEKRKNQVITPNEARELQKTFQEYKKQVETSAADIQSALETALLAVKGLQGHKK